MRTRLNHLAAVGAVVALLAACGGSGDSSSDASASTTVAPVDTEPAETLPAVTETTAPPTTAAPETAAISSFDQIQPAAIQIIAQGSFRDPEVGTVVGAGAGSGFIISPDGLAVTNNHVVTGAATLEVFIGGDTSKSYNAQVLGVSECNDLALIKITTNDALPYLEWSSSVPTVGTEVYAAGFPLGESEFTMTRGIVAKANASGDTPWSSIDEVIEHDANIQHGNSGGPLVGVDGKVLGVNYRGREQLSTVQFFAISSALAQQVVAKLQNGDFEALGINGSAVYDEASGIAGVWVSGTEPGTPASNAGIVAGDIVTALNGLPIGTDGTMKDYCDVIRTAGDNPIKVEVLRYDSQEVLEGEINGDLPLQQVFSFADQIEDEGANPDATGSAYSGQSVALVDDTGVLSVSVPAEWTDIDTVPLDDGTAWISASPNLDEFYSTYNSPGMVMTWSPTLATGDIPSAIAGFGPADGECATDEGLFDYDDGFFVGQYELWTDCGGVGAVGVVLVANANAGTGAVLIVAQLLTDADFDALDTIMATFDIIA